MDGINISFYAIMTATMLSYAGLHFGCSYVLYRIGRKFSIGDFWDYCLPIYDSVLLCRCAGLSGWNALGMVCPITYPLWTVYIFGSLARRLGQSFWLYGLGALVKIPIVILALAKAEPVERQLSTDLSESFSGYQSAHIYCLSGEYAGQEIELVPQGIIVGRDPACANLIISQDEVSRKHVIIYPDDNDARAVIVEDLNSVNGTFYFDSEFSEWVQVNGAVKVPRCQQIRFCIGCGLFEFVIN